MGISLYSLAVVLVALDVTYGSCLPGYTCCSEVVDPKGGHASNCKTGMFCPVGSVVSYWCDWPGVIQGQNVATCQQNPLLGATWSAFPPYCGPDPNYCDRLPAVANAYPLACQGSLCVRGTQVYVSCQPGFQPGLAQTVTCVQSLGRSAWSATPSCITQGSLALGGLGNFGNIFSGLFGGAGKKK